MGLFEEKDLERKIGHNTPRAFIPPVVFSFVETELGKKILGEAGISPIKNVLDATRKGKINVIKFWKKDRIEILLKNMEKRVKEFDAGDLPLDYIIKSFPEENLSNDNLRFFAEKLSMCICLLLPLSIITYPNEIPPKYPDIDFPDFKYNEDIGIVPMVSVLLELCEKALDEVRDFLTFYFVFCK